MNSAERFSSSLNFTSGLLYYEETRIYHFAAKLVKQRRYWGSG
jgi:hypothetical protein